MNNSKYFSSVPDADVICQAAPSLPAMTPEGASAATFPRPFGVLARCRPVITGLRSSAGGWRPPGRCGLIPANGFYHGIPREVDKWKVRVRV